MRNRTSEGPWPFPAPVWLRAGALVVAGLLLAVLAPRTSAQQGLDDGHGEPPAAVEIVRLPPVRPYSSYEPVVPIAFFSEAEAYEASVAEPREVGEFCSCEYCSGQHCEDCEDCEDCESCEGCGHGESGGWLSSLWQPFYLNRDGSSSADAVSASVRVEVLQNPNIIKQTVSSLLYPFYATHDNDTPPANRPSAAGHSHDRLARIPKLVRPIYLTNDGRYGDDAETSTTVEAAKWAETTGSYLPVFWEQMLLQPLVVKNDINDLPTPPPAAKQAPAVTFPKASFASFQPNREPLLDENGEPLPSPFEDDTPESTGERIPSPSDAPSDQAAQTQADEQKLGQAPEDTSLQFLRTQTVLLKPGEMQIDVGVAYTLEEETFPVLIDPTTVIEAQLRRRQLIVPIEFRYGLHRRAQAFVNMPFGWANTELSSTGADEFDNEGGIGDVRAGATLLLKEGKEKGPDVIGTIGFTAPTGNGAFFPTTSAVPTPDLGEGFWALSGDVLLIHNYDPVVVFYGLGVSNRFEASDGGRRFQPGVQYTYLLGTGFAVNERVTFSTVFSGAYVSELQIDGDRVPGTIQEPLSVRLAATISRKKRLIEPFVTFGLTDDATAARFGITWTR